MASVSKKAIKLLVNTKSCIVDLKYKITNTEPQYKWLQFLNSKKSMFPTFDLIENISAFV